MMMCFTVLFAFVFWIVVSKCDAFLPGYGYISTCLSVCLSILLSIGLSLYVYIYIIFLLQERFSNDCISKCFEGVGSSFYFGIITMSTVGYGDFTPKTIVGKVW